MTYAQRLAAQQDAWANTPVDSGPGPRSLPPDGDYQARVNRFDFIESDKGLLLKTELEVVAPAQQVGWPMETIHALENPERFGITKKHLYALGIEIEDLTQLEGLLHGALDAIVDVTVKTGSKRDENGNPYRNAYVNGVIQQTIQPDIPVDMSDFAPAEVAPEEEEPPPF